MKLIKLYIFLFAICAVNSLEKARYDNYRVYQIEIDDDKQLQLLKEIETYPDGVGFILSFVGDIDLFLFLSVSLLLKSPSKTWKN